MIQINQTKNRVSLAGCFLGNKFLFISFTSLFAVGCTAKVNNLQHNTEPLPVAPRAINEFPKPNAEDGKWTLEEFYALAETQNSTLLMQAQQINASRGRFREAANPPNPELIARDGSVASGNSTFSRGKMVGISQEILLPGKLSKAKNVELQEIRSLEVDYQVALLQLRESIRRVVINLQANLLLERLQWEYISAIDQIISSTEKQSDLNRLEIERKSLALEITALVVENSVLGNQLETLLGLNKFGQIQSAAIQLILDKQINSQALAQLDAIAEENFLPLISRLYRLEREKANYSLVKSNLYDNPSVETTFGANDFTGENEVGLGIRFPLPLFSRQQGNIQTAEAMIAFESEQYRNEERELKRELSELQQRSNELDTFIVEYRDNIIPWAESSFDKVASELRTSQTTIHDYLSILQRLLVVKQTAILYQRDLSLVQSRVQTYLNFADPQYSPVNLPQSPTDFQNSTAIIP
ncbi:MAG: TolC family protein [Sumerlaeia bacterium]